MKGYVLKDNFRLDHDRYNKYINLKNRAAQDKKYEDLRKVNEGKCLLLKISLIWIREQKKE